MAIERKGNYWVDNRNNKWNVVLYSEAKAFECSATLIACTSCTNCRDCSDCNYCDGCYKCNNCNYCNSCNTCCAYNGNKRYRLTFYDSRL